ncbi:MAG: hypothetical protein AB7G28_22900 [Pirellulales bacterium]
MSHNTHSTVGQNAGCAGLRIADCRLRLSRTPIRNPKSKIRNLTMRPGISLTEVLIAMGILTVGLLGVAAIFPVAGFYMQKGEVADRGSAIAQAAFNELIARGMLNPELWQEIAWNSGTLYPTISGVDGATNSYSRPVAAAMNADLARLNTLSLTDDEIQKRLARRIGNAFIIDPLGVAGTTIPAASNGNLAVSAFPMAAYSSPIYSNANQWITWWPDLSGAERGKEWPVRRVTFRSPDLTRTDVVTVARMDARVADTLFTAQDDLALDVPTAADKPSIQKLTIASTDLNGDGMLNDVLARSSRGDYSWLATVVPTSASAWRALASGVAKSAYEVSVVVFHKRVVSRNAPQSPSDAIAAASDLLNQERVVKARIVSTGLNGGELLLEKLYADTITESAFQGLKVGNWVMLCGPSPSSTDREPLFVLRWYRVLSIEGKDRRLNVNGTYDPAPAASEPERRLVTLRGPQWPWQPAMSGSTLDLANDNQLSNSLCVGIIPGAVAVHSKTVQIESVSTWDGGATGLAASPTQPQWITH